MAHPIFEANLFDIYDKFAITPVPFKNGGLENKTGENSASAAIFAYAAEMGLSDGETLELFGEHLQAVTNNPDGNDHENIRQFMKTGHNGIEYLDGQDGLHERNEKLSETVLRIWDDRDDIKSGLDFDGRNAILAIYEGIEKGYLGPVAVDFNALGKAETPKDGQAACHVLPWVKQGLLLGFRLFEKRRMGQHHDTLPTMHYSWEEFEKLPISDTDYRMVPPGYRRGTYSKGVSMMPNSWQNAGSRLGAGTMLDGGSTAGSCSRTGKNCHISGKAGLGGVFEPFGAIPVVIGDHVFIGLCSEPAEGCIVASGAVLAPSLVLTGSTKIFDLREGKDSKVHWCGFVPHDTLVVPGTYERSPGIHIACAYVIKDIDPANRGKVDINKMLRDL